MPIYRNKIKFWRIIILHYLHTNEAGAATLITRNYDKDDIKEINLPSDSVFSLNVCEMFLLWPRKISDPMRVYVTFCVCISWSAQRFLIYKP